MIPKYKLYKNKKKSQVTKGNKGNSKRPRLSVFRSNRYIYAQLIDDVSGKTLISAGENEIKDNLKSLKPVEIAKSVGKLLAEKAAKKKIVNAVFDRHNYKYHGRVKSLAQGAREAGLKI